MTRYRPTMDDYRDAQRYRWLRDHAHDIALVEGEWRGYLGREQILPVDESFDLNTFVNLMRPLLQKAMPAPAETEIPAAREARGQDG